MLGVFWNPQDLLVLMGTEIFKINASWAEKLMKTRVSFLMTPTVVASMLHGMCEDDIDVVRVAALFRAAPLHAAPLVNSFLHQSPGSRGPIGGLHGWVESVMDQSEAA